jgi:hypothetical protein
MSTSRIWSDYSVFLGLLSRCLWSVTLLYAVHYVVHPLRPVSFGQSLSRPVGRHCGRPTLLQYSVFFPISCNPNPWTGLLYQACGLEHSFLLCMTVYGLLLSGVQTG